MWVGTTKPPLSVPGAVTSGCLGRAGLGWVGRHRRPSRIYEVKIERRGLNKAQKKMGQGRETGKGREAC